MIVAFTSLKKAARSMNLLIDQEKTKYIPVTKKSHTNYSHYLEVGPYKFQVVHSFTYLGSDVNCNNDIDAEIQKGILAENRCFYGPRKHLRSHLTSKNTKIMMYKVPIRPVFTYASETWTVSKANERRLSLKEMCFDVFSERNKRSKYDEKYIIMNYNINDSNIVNYIKVKRLVWAGHVMCMNDHRTINKILNTRLDGVRRVGRPKMRWKMVLIKI
jgi:hypothetical protein